MTTYVALLRAIGPVTHAKMPLKDLTRKIGEDAINVVSTGNIIFASEKSEAEVKHEVAAAVASFGLDCEVFIRTRRQIQMLVGSTPFAEARAHHPNGVGVCFFHKTPKWPDAYLHYTGPEKLAMFSNHLIVDYGGPVTGTKLTIEKTVGARMTQRNWSTVLRVAEKMGL
jgi:uncharacterized protein (DUF1697 family)